MQRSLAPFLLALACLCAPAAIATSQERPNILFLFADDLRRDAIGALSSDPAVATPSLDALAARGTVLTQVSCMGAMHGAVCMPSRAMLMSGRYLTRVRDDLRDTTTLPEVLRAHGYATFMAGKWHNGDPALLRAFPEARCVFRGGMCDHFHVPLCDATGGKVENVRTGDRHSSELFANAAIDFLRARSGAAKDEPFFAYVAFTAPHDPRDPPPNALRQVLAGPHPSLPKNFRGQHGLDLGSQTMTVRDENLLGWPRDPALLQRQLCEYHALVRDLDAHIGRVLRTLADTGLAERTLVVFAADHGLALGSHGLLGKQSLYEHSMGAPVILRGPGVPSGVRRTGLAYLLDLMPTIAVAAGATPPDGVDGVDLGPLVRGEGKGRDALFTLYCETQRALRIGDDKLIRLPQIDRTLWFDLSNDPDELHDLAGDPALAERRRALEERLRAEQQRAGDEQPWTAATVKPAEIDLTGKRWKADQWQPKWIRDAYFPRTDPDLNARVLPLPPEAFYGDPAWHHWGASVVQADDGTWHMFHSRWPSALVDSHQTNSFQDWLWHSEIAHAVAPAMAGPWRHLDTALKGRGDGHWDRRNAHNPRLRRFCDRWHLYYVADTRDFGSDADRTGKGPNWMPLRNSQRIGVAVADSLDGPWTRGDAPLLAPGGPIANVAVNPTIVQRPGGDYLMLAKGDRPGSRAYRYGIALADSPTGPFAWQEHAIDTGFSSEDPDVFFDAARGRYYALITQTRGNKGRAYVENGGIGIIRSDDGLTWTDADHPLVLRPTLRLADGSERAFQRIERPGFVFDRAGRIVGLTCAGLPDGGGNAMTIVVPLRRED